MTTFRHKKSIYGNYKHLYQWPTSEWIPRKRVLFKKLAVALVFNKFPDIHRNRKHSFITVSRLTNHWSIFWARWISTYLLKIHVNFITHLLLCRPSGYFLPGFRTKLCIHLSYLCMPHASPISYSFTLI